MKRRDALKATAAITAMAATGMTSSTTEAEKTGAQNVSSSGKREILVSFGVDVDAVSGWIGTYGGEDSVRDLSRGVFAAEVGIPRLLNLFEKWGVKQSFFIPGHSIETFPKQMEMIVDAGHEIGAHGYTHENPTKMTRQQEADVLDKSIELIVKLCGKRPRGNVAPFWDFSKATCDLLLDRGIVYDHSMMAHDFQPYFYREIKDWEKVDYDKPAATWMKPMKFGKQTKLVEIPSSWYGDDLPPMMFMDKEGTGMGYTSPQTIEQLWRDRFDWMYREYQSATYTVTIHPDVSGHPQNLLMLERLYDHMAKHDGVEFVTFGEIADRFLAKNPVG